MTDGSSSLWKSEDWWAVWFGFLLILASLTRLVTEVPKIGRWTDDPLSAFGVGSGEGTIVLPLLGLMLGLGVLTTLGIAIMKAEPPSRYALGFAGVFVISCIAYWIANQTNIRYWGLSYALWALLVGLLISNTIGTPKWLRPAAKTELFIKTGLVLLGAEILFKKIISMGAPGLMVAWLVTPTVVIFMLTES